MFQKEQRWITRRIFPVPQITRFSEIATQITARLHVMDGSTIEFKRNFGVSSQRVYLFAALTIPVCKRVIGL